MTQTISWCYIAGLLETDGSFSLALTRSGHYLVTISISSQTKHTGLLELLLGFFNSVGIVARIDNQTATILSAKAPTHQKSMRAGQIRIRGPLNVLLFCSLLEKNTKKIPFCSQKLRDFFIIKQAILNRKFLCPAEKIDLLMSLHKTQYKDVDITKYSQKLLRHQHEKRLGLSLNQSKGAAQLILSEIDTKYNDHKQKIYADCSNKSLSFDDQWFVGLIDGDGYFGLRMRFNKKSVRFYPSFSLGMEIEAELTLNVFAEKFTTIGSKKIHRNAKKEATSVELIFYGNDIQNLVVFCNKNPPLNKVKRAQLDLINLFFLFEKNNLLNNYEKVSELIQMCYSVNLLGKARGRLKYSQDEALKLLLSQKLLKGWPFNGSVY